MRKAFLASGYDEEKANLALAQMNFDSEGELDYSQFVQSSMDPRMLVTEENMMSVFKQLDVGGQGNISTAEVHQALIRSGKDMDKTEVEGMMQELNLDPEDRMSFKTFFEAVKFNPTNAHMSVASMNPNSELEYKERTDSLMMQFQSFKFKKDAGGGGGGGEGSLK